jgi:hypothetical protein
MTETKSAPLVGVGGTEINRFNALKHWGVVALHGTAVGGCRRVPCSGRSTGGRTCTAGTDRQRSTWSRNWPASCGANGAYA